MTRAKARCVACDTVLAAERVRAQLAAERGGADVLFDAEGRRMGGARLLAVVMVQPHAEERQYRLPTDLDYDAIRKAKMRRAVILEGWVQGGKQSLCPVPDEPLPPIRDTRVSRAAVWHSPMGRSIHGSTGSSTSNVVRDVSRS